MESGECDSGVRRAFLYPVVCFRAKVSVDFSTRGAASESSAGRLFRKKIAKTEKTSSQRKKISLQLRITSTLHLHFFTASSVFAEKLKAASTKN
ncbi:MAG: hypothetical protein LBC14_00180 [Desulfovibrio sp.]|jgi:hypothetical protein|nr:hypothetical protein [Desulfovibrio sp.]